MDLPLRYIMCVSSWRRSKQEQLVSSKRHPCVHYPKDRSFNESVCAMLQRVAPNALSVELKRKRSKAVECPSDFGGLCFKSRAAKALSLFWVLRPSCHVAKNPVSFPSTPGPNLGRRDVRWKHINSERFYICIWGLNVNNLAKTWTMRS